MRIGDDGPAEGPPSKDKTSKETVTCDEQASKNLNTKTPKKNDALPGHKVEPIMDKEVPSVTPPTPQIKARQGPSVTANKLEPRARFSSPCLASSPDQGKKEFQAKLRKKASMMDSRMSSNKITKKEKEQRSFLPRKRITNKIKKCVMEKTVEANTERTTEMESCDVRSRDLQLDIRKGRPKYKSINDLPKNHLIEVTETIPPDEFFIEDVTLSQNMVVQSIVRKSPMFERLIVGDQLIKINKKFLTCPDDVFVESAKEDVSVRLIRPWNVYPAQMDLISWRVRMSTDVQFLSVEIHDLRGKRGEQLNLGFSLMPNFVVEKVEKDSLGAFALIPGDQLRAVERSKAGQFKNTTQIFEKIHSCLKEKGVCVVQISRPSQYRSSIIPSIYAKTMPIEKPGDEISEDAAEIGIREAFRSSLTRKLFRPVPVLISREPNPEKLQRRKKKRDSGENAIVSKKVQTSTVSSDVEDERTLQKVTEKSDMTTFVFDMPKSIFQKLTNLGGK